MASSFGDHEAENEVMDEKARNWVEKSVKPRIWSRGKREKKANNGGDNLYLATA